MQTSHNELKKNFEDLQKEVKNPKPPLQRGFQRQRFENMFQPNEPFVNLLIPPRIFHPDEPLINL